jgi:hypothetical protein
MPATSYVSARVSLACNGTTPNPFVQGIEATLVWNQDQALLATYRVRADTRGLRIPDPTTPRQVDDLWQHTCFELFVGFEDSPAYYEWNFSPSGEWAIYAFRTYRDRESLEGSVIAPEISIQKCVDQLEFAATTRLDRFLLIRKGISLRLGLSAILETTDGALSYWALKHPAANPDFHHPGSFALEFAVPMAKA